MVRNNKDIAEHLARAAHDMRNPLHTIMGYADLIRLKSTMVQDQEFRQTSVEMARQATLVIESTKYLSGIVDDLLVLYHGNDDGELHKTGQISLPLAAVVDDVALSVKQQSFFVAQRLRITVDEQCAHMLVKRAYRFRRILQNLLTNAVQASSADAEVIMEITSDPQSLSCTVRNDGVGIDFDTRVFNPNQTPTVGLGLAIVTELLQSYGGYGVWTAKPRALVRINIPTSGLLAPK